jgi:hypothetical protein
VSPERATSRKRLLEAIGEFLMPKLPQRSIIKKITTILDFANQNRPTTPKELSIEIAKARRIEFSYFKPSGDSRPRLGYSKPPSIVNKIYFAIALTVLKEDCTLAIVKNDYSSESKAIGLLSERSRDLLDQKGMPITTILTQSKKLLKKDPPILPTAMKLYAELKPDGLSFTWFRYCLSILLFEQSGLLGASARRIYLPRGGEHQTPGEIGS